MRGRRGILYHDFLSVFAHRLPRPLGRFIPWIFYKMRTWLPLLSEEWIPLQYDSYFGRNINQVGMVYPPLCCRRFCREKNRKLAEWQCPPRGWNWIWSGAIKKGGCEKTQSSFFRYVQPHSEYFLMNRLPVNSMPSTQIPLWSTEESITEVNLTATASLIDRGQVVHWCLWLHWWTAGSSVKPWIFCCKWCVLILYRFDIWLNEMNGCAAESLLH